MITAKPDTTKLCPGPLVWLQCALFSLCFCWVAIYNQFPLLFPDSVGYLEAGSTISQHLAGSVNSKYFGIRSVFYSASTQICCLSPWLLVVMQSAITVGVIEIFLKHVVPGLNFLQKLFGYVVLSLTTSISFFTGYVMPDYLAPLLVLTTFLLVFRNATLNLRELICLASVHVFAMLSHGTHVLLSGGMLLFVIAIVFWKGKKFSPANRPKLETIIFCHIAWASIAVTGNLALYDSFSSPPHRPPFLTARMIGDGTAQRYLKSGKSVDKWAINDFRHRLGDTSGDFLWGADGVCATATGDANAKIKEQDLRFAAHAVMYSPFHQVIASFSNWMDQLVFFEIGTFYKDPYNDNVAEPYRAPYMASLQGRGEFNFRGWEKLQLCTVLGCLGCIGLAFFTRLRCPPESAEVAKLVAVFIVVGLIGNAFVTGVFSTPYDRYQARIIWFIPFLVLVYTGLIFANRNKIR